MILWRTDGNFNQVYCESFMSMEASSNVPAFPGLPHVREKSGKLKFFQGQGIVREFCKLSGKFGNTVKCQGIVREF